MAEKLKYLEFRLGKPIDKIALRPEYRALSEFYKDRFLEKIKSKEPHEATEGISDMEAVRSDRDYELFYIRHEDGAPYFNLDLLRHMRLVSDFESEGENFEEDPLLQVRSMMDRDTHASASQILHACRRQMDDFYKIFRKISTNDLALALSSAITALFLSANPRNLLSNTTGKTALSYFEDFHSFLRAGFKTPEYQKMIAYPPEKTDTMAYVLLNLIHALSDRFFHRNGGVKQESIGLIHRTSRRGTEKTSEKKGVGIWNQFLIEDENYRTLLAKFPSGPLLKIIDLVRAEESVTVPFDPIAQNNFPVAQFSAISRGREFSFLRIPSPTKQTLISKVEIVDEFRGLLRFYHMQNKGQKHLLINLQDRSSWKEFARAKALEAMQKNAEFNAVLVVFTLPKSTDFYFQTGQYLNVNSASDFFASFLKQLGSPEEFGYCLPPSFKPAELQRFAEDIFPLIHTYFFEKKSNLTRGAREDFIDIFNQFLLLKLIDHFHPSSISFTCKDAIDTGAAESASFYAFLKLLKNEFKTKEEHDYFRWLLYAPSLFVRERAIDGERFNRMLSSLERLENGFIENSKEILRKFEELYNPELFKTLEIKN